MSTKPLYRIDGKLMALCDCPRDEGECALGRERTLFTAQLSQCLVPVQEPVLTVEMK